MLLIFEILLFALLLTITVLALVTLLRTLRAGIRRHILMASNGAPYATHGVGISAVCSGVHCSAQIENLLDVEYPAYEVVLVLDAQRDPETFAAILARYRMIGVQYLLSEELPVLGVRMLYRSRQRCYRRLVVLDKASTSSMDDFDAATGVASYDYLLPVCGDAGLLPQTIERLVAEITLCSVGSLHLVRSFMTLPVQLIARDVVITEGGFHRDLGSDVPRIARRTLYQPLMYHMQQPTCGTSRWWWVVALLLLLGMVFAAYRAWWPLTSLLLTAAAVWCTVRCAAPIIMSHKVLYVDCRTTMRYCLRKFGAKYFTVS